MMFKRNKCLKNEKREKIKWSKIEKDKIMLTRVYNHYMVGKQIMQQKGKIIAKGSIL